MANVLGNAFENKVGIGKAQGVLFQASAARPARPMLGFALQRPFWPARAPAQPERPLDHPVQVEG